MAYGHPSRHIDEVGAETDALVDSRAGHSNTSTPKATAKPSHTRFTDHEPEREYVPEALVATFDGGVALRGVQASARDAVLGKQERAQRAVWGGCAPAKAAMKTGGCLILAAAV